MSWERKFLFQVTPTGYIQVTRPGTTDGITYGYDILPAADGITALAHNHFFDFKVDLDVGDVANSFKVEYHLLYA